MAKQQLFKGKTSQTLPIFVQDNSVVSGAGLTGLLYNSPGLTWWYHRESAGTAVQVTLATATLGAYTSGGFVEVDAVNLPGFYELGIPDPALADGADYVSMMLMGAVNMIALPCEIELISENTREYSGLKRNRAFTALPFVMLGSVDRLPLAGLTVTVERLIDAGTLVAGTLSAVTDKGSGVYTVDGLAADTNGVYLTFRCSAVGAIDSVFTVITVP